MTKHPSKLGETYNKLYRWLCGTLPHPKPWHFQWLSAYYLSRDLEWQLSKLHGVVLDVGCGNKPYAAYMPGVSTHVGVDIAPGIGVDVVIPSERSWPFANATFDAVIATQVLEHVKDLDLALAEIQRVVKPGGSVVLTVPFLYNVHGAPNDYRRFTTLQASSLLPELQLSNVKSEGGIGSTLVTLLLNWLDASFNRTFATRVAKAVLLPLWLLFCLANNILGLVFDWLDRTDSFYSNAVFVYRAGTNAGEKLSGQGAEEIS